MDYEMIRLMVFVTLLLLVILTSAFFNRFQRATLAFCLVMTTIVIVYEVTLPQRITATFEELQPQVEAHLQRHYPNEEWQITYDTATTSSSGYAFAVTFLNEKDIIYYYKVEDEAIVQTSISAVSNEIDWSKLLHEEL
ncbi:hypothetical protein [Caryophanon tenue]|uniref:DUF3139 domain-containing protein n=1 Tax=Caryophanon tenue TaxID=33978 RepID=A0A1C0YE14_9BACL|nr:hypothetical protein [Caryophanon tenue]OCS85391.1 hypothetical protein A6M13_13200 [Caryophanon tenue]